MSLHPRANNLVREAKGKEIHIIHSSMVSVIKGKNSVMRENIKENMILNGGWVIWKDHSMCWKPEVGVGRAKCRGKSFLVKRNISYLVRYISNLVISIYVCIYIHICTHMNNLFEDPDPENRSAKESTE